MNVYGSESTVTAKRNRIAARAAIVMAVLELPVALAGCVSEPVFTATASPPASPAGPQPPQTSAPQTSAPQTSAPATTTEITTTEGFRFRLSYSVSYPDATVDPTSAASGRTRVRAHPAIDVRITNETGGGHSITPTSFGATGITAFELFRASSPLCTVERYPQPGVPCAYELGHTHVPNPAIADGSTADLPISGAVSITVPESKAATITALLPARPQILLKTEGWNNEDPATDAALACSDRNGNHLDALLAAPAGWSCPDLIAALDHAG